MKDSRRRQAAPTLSQQQAVTRYEAKHVTNHMQISKISITRMKSIVNLLLQQLEKEGRKRDRVDGPRWTLQNIRYTLILLFGQKVKLLIVHVHKMHFLRLRNTCSMSYNRYSSDHRLLALPNTTPILRRYGLTRAFMRGAV